MKEKDVSEEVFEDMKSNGRDLKTFYISNPSGIGKSKICKRFGKKNKYQNGKSKILFILAQQQNMKAYDFIDSEYKAQDVTIFDDIE